MGTVKVPKYKIINSYKKRKGEKPIRKKTLLKREKNTNVEKALDLKLRKIPQTCLKWQEDEVENSK